MAQNYALTVARSPELSRLIIFAMPVAMNCNSVKPQD